MGTGWAVTSLQSPKNVPGWAVANPTCLLGGHGKATMLRSLSPAGAKARQRTPEGGLLMSLLQGRRHWLLGDPR